MSLRAATLWLGALTGGLTLAGISGEGLASEITQYFPAPVGGASAPKPETGWRIKYEILPARGNSYGNSAVWEFQSIEFMRGYTPSGEEDWIKVLNNLALGEMYVPYNDGREIFDISGTFGFSFVTAKPEYLPTGGVISAKLLDDYVAAEVVDDNLRWMDLGDTIRRGQVLELWATLNAGNYRYVIKYGFADDGTIHIRAGGTAKNLRSVPVGDHKGVHIHSPAWRMEFDLGDPAANRVEIVERHHDSASAKAEITHDVFNNGVEGGELWNAEQFTSLMVTNTKNLNRHDPAHNIAYKLVSLRSGSTRTFRPHTSYDFWTLRLDPDAPNRIPENEKLFVDIASYISNPEPIDGKPVAIWHTTALHHIPRTEDFGAVGYNAGDGLAIMMWTGFDLMPHNLWDKTPLFSR